MNSEECYSSLNILGNYLIKKGWAMGKKYYYARVSSKEQKLDRQINIFKEMGATDRLIFSEKQSGKNFEDRTVWQELMSWVSEGDIIVVKNFDRLGRNKKEVKEVMLDLANRNIYLESIDQAYLNEYLRENIMGNKENESFGEAIKEYFFQIMLDIDLLRAEYERKEIARRRDEGIAAARKKGKKFGRPVNKEIREKFMELYPFTRNKDNINYRTIKSVVEEIGCSRKQFYRLEEELIKNKR